VEVNKVVLGDCIEGMSGISDSTIDLAVTSPPYKDSDGYNLRLMYDFIRQVYRILKPNSLFFLNFGHLAEDKFRPFEVCHIARECGFNLNDTIVWIKNHYRPIQGNKRLNNLTEFIFLLYKGEMPDLDRLSIGVPYADKSNAKRFASGRDLKCGGNTWYIPYETIQKSSQKHHPDRFPVELPERCIKLSGVKSGTILDPFAGSGSSMIAAINYGLDFIGFEKNEENWEIACHRINERIKQKNS
jgi:site-specific DNA-methyltransferase (adenine-specific)